MRYLSALLATVATVLLTLATGHTPADASGPAAPTPAAAECTGLQKMINDAPTTTPPATVTLPADCIYREWVVINKPLILQGEEPLPGKQRAEIRGSDVWTGWTFDGKYWTKSGLKPFTVTTHKCKPYTDRCNLPEQVFFDGKPLFQVAANPTSGQFAVIGDTRDTIQLADDPTGHTVEVTVRTSWIQGKADDVTIRGLTMRHAANPAHLGAIRTSIDSTATNRRNRWAVENNYLYQTHGPIVSLLGGEGHKVIGNDLGWGGQFGVHGHDLKNTLVQRNEIHNNNTEEYWRAWSSGGLKIVHSDILTIENNHVHHNLAPGLWCDWDCNNTNIFKNRIHHNATQGILYELSHTGDIYDNVIYSNGWDWHAWGWGGGITLASSDTTKVHNNVIAWNADGIAVRWTPSFRQWRGAF